VLASRTGSWVALAAGQADHGGGTEEPEDRAGTGAGDAKPGAVERVSRSEPEEPVGKVVRNGEDTQELERRDEWYAGVRGGEFRDEALRRVGRVDLAAQDWQAEAHDVVHEKDQRDERRKPVEDQHAYLAGKVRLVLLSAPLPDDGAENHVECERNPDKDELDGDQRRWREAPGPNHRRAREQLGILDEVDHHERAERQHARELEGAFEEARGPEREATLRHAATLPWLLRLPRYRLPSLVAALVAVVFAVPGCGGDRGPASPDVSLAGGSEVQAEFRSLRARFFDADARGRAALIDPLRAFLARFPKDPRAGDVRNYLAFGYVERGDRKTARALLAPVLSGPPGSQQDFARVVDAAILSRDGENQRALQALDALGGRIIDLDERFVYGEERARAAFLAGNLTVALRALLDWLVQAPPDRLARARRTADTLLGLVPVDDLVAALGSLQPLPGASKETERGRSWLVGAIVTRLTRVALERSSAPLARQLLEVAPAALRGTPDGQKLVALAAAGQRAPTVVGRAVGLLLGLSSSADRRRASAIGQGITVVLDSSKGGAKGPRVDLVVRYGTDDVPAAFTALAADGAALIIAGGDDESARRAAAQAETLEIPLMLLRPPEVPPLVAGFTFVLGLDDTVVEDVLTDALAERGVHRPERVGRGGTSCDVDAVAPGKPRFPLAAWKTAGVDALVVTGDADCAGDVARELSAARRSWPFALGLDASHAYATLGRSTLVVQAGTYPDKAPAGGWYEALGHDAGALAARALEALPQAGVVQGEDVAGLRRRVRDALAAAEADLWTSEARGFGGARVLPRKLNVLAAGPKAP